MSAGYLQVAVELWAGRETEIVDGSSNLKAWVFLLPLSS